MASRESFTSGQLGDLRMAIRVDGFVEVERVKASGLGKQCQIVLTCGEARNLGAWVEQLTAYPPNPAGTVDHAAPATEDQLLYRAVSMCPLGVDAGTLNSFLQAALGKTHAEAGRLIRRGIDRGTIRVGSMLNIFMGDRPDAS